MRSEPDRSEESFVNWKTINEMQMSISWMVRSWASMNPVMLPNPAGFVSLLARLLKIPDNRPEPALISVSGD
jgi:hypothetical protein